MPCRKVLTLPGDRTVAYVDQGSGPAVVLLHGSLTLLDDMWLGLSESLLPAFRVIALDRPGHGGSHRQRVVDASPWRQAALVRDALLALDVPRSIVVGHSYGGTVALCHGLAYPANTAGVVALAPLCFPEVRLEQVLFGVRGIPVWGDGLSQILATGLDPSLLPILWQSIFLPQTMPPRFAATFPFKDAAGPHRLVVEGEDAIAVGPALAFAALAYPTCRVPVRILGGTADIVVNNAVHGLRAVSMMPRANFDWVPGVGHMLHHARPEAVVEAIRDLLL